MIIRTLKKFWKPILFILIGIGISFFLFKNKEKSGNTVESSRIIGHEIKKLNKMIVIEQNYSAFQTKKYNDFNPRYLDFLNKNIVLYITAKAQVTYNMKEMKIKVDSVNKKIHIISIPEPELSVYPNVEIYSMEKGFLNDFSKKDLNMAMNEGKKEIQKTVDNSGIKTMAHKQLIENLKDLYTIAQLYKWKVIDSTPYSKELESLQNKSMY